MAVTPAEYERIVESIWKEGSTKEQRRNVHPNLAMNYIRAFWKQEVGTKFRWKIRIGTGNRRTWLHRGVFTVNPEQGWHDINHDMSHFIERRKTGGAHTDQHIRLERNGAALIVRRFLRDEPYVEPKKEVDHVAKRAASVDARIKKWETKLRRATTALKKLKKQKKYYDAKLAERGS
jgi:hypothetical protein